MKYIACFRHEDLKEMLDSNKDGLKLEAMKRIIGVIKKLLIHIFNTNVLSVTCYFSSDGG